MKFFIDTANIAEIKEANSMGMVDGVTTNPTLIAKEEGKFEDIIKQICEIVDGPISAEVISLDTDGMVGEARKLADIHKNIAVKIPMTVEGLKAVRTLSTEVEESSTHSEASRLLHVDPYPSGRESWR